MPSIRFSLPFLLLCSIATAAPKREVTPRTAIPPAVLPLVPQHGIYAAGGGLTSSAWRVVVDFDAGTISAGTNAKSGAPSYGQLPKQTTKKLSVADRDRLRKLGTAAWDEPAPSAPQRPTADYDELLIVADGKDTYYLDGYGPIRRKAGASAIAELRKLGGL